jgi:hypothetical protein
MPDRGNLLARVFVGSAGKSHTFARRVALQLEQQASERAEPVMIKAHSWKYTFSSGDITYQRLLKCVRKDYNFGVFIFTADDDAHMDGMETKITRDNVIFELGLWAGRYGKDHALVLKPTGVEMRLLTDLEGFVTEPFDPRSDQSLDEAAGNLLKKIIEVAETDRRKRLHGSTSQDTHLADSLLRQQLEARLRSGALEAGSRENLKQGMLVISAIYGLGQVLSSDDELIRVKFFDSGARVLIHSEVALPNI